jgi:two-component system OmpR family sensor kinase
MRPTVRARILLSILLVAAIGMGFAGLVTFLVQRDRTLSEIDDRLVASVETAREMLSTPSVEYATTRDAMQAILARFVPRHDESTLGIIDGQPAYVPAVDQDYPLENDTALVERVVSETADGAVHAGVETEPAYRRYIAAPVNVAGDPETGVYVVAINVDEELEELYSSYRTYALVALIALLAIGVVGWFVAGRLLRPIRQLSSAASRITGSDRAERIPVSGHDDVSELTRTVNDMLDRLDTALTGQRQLLDDVRHELKTPITIVRGHLELLSPSDPKEVAATRDLALDELDRMAGLVDDIEAFAETQLAPPSREYCDVAELTRAVFAKAQVLPGVRWRLGAVATAVISADASRLTQAWLQLADNAAKYAPPGSTVTLGSSLGAAGVELWVEDEGPGVAAEAESRIFERFGRIDTGRGIRGSGLGLPIVRSIARSHDGEATVAAAGSGSRFTITIPANGRP